MAINIGFATVGLPCKIKALCYYSSIVQFASFVATCQ